MQLYFEMDKSYFLSKGRFWVFAYINSDLSFGAYSPLSIYPHLLKQNQANSSLFMPFSKFLWSLATSSKVEVGVRSRTQVNKDKVFVCEQRLLYAQGISKKRATSTPMISHKSEVARCFYFLFLLGRYEGTSFYKKARFWGKSISH